MKKYLIRIKPVIMRLSQIKKESKKGYLGILKEFYLYQNKVGITFSEYFDYQFDQQPKSLNDTFLSSKDQKKYLEILNPQKYSFITRNKYITHLFLANVGIPKSTLYCYYNPTSKFKSKDHGYNHDSVYKIIKEKKLERFMIKTTESYGGKGVMLAEKVEFKDDTCFLHLFNGEVVSLSDILRNEPLIFESVINQTEQFSEFNASSVNTIRFITILMPSGDAEIIGATLRIGRKGSCIDNATQGRNIDASVNLDTGRISDVIKYNGQRNTSSVLNHPDSGALLEGVIIKNWDEIKNYIIEYQKAVPFLKSLGWDIAITENGPVVIEINESWGVGLQRFHKFGWRPKVIDCYHEWVSLNNQ